MMSVVQSVSFLDGRTGHTQKIKEAMYEAAKQFVYIGFLLWEVEAYGYYREHDYKDVYAYAAAELNLKKTTVKNLIAINYEFGCRDDRPAGIAHQRTMSLQPAYRDFNYSQLTEMLSMSDKQRSQVTPDMSVRQIREIKKEPAPVPEPEFPLEPQYETTPIELPGSEPEPAVSAVGQTSDQTEMITLELHEDDAHFLYYLLREEMSICTESEPEYCQADRLIREFQRLGIFY